jgi:Alpha amylase, catalytic domain
MEPLSPHPGLYEINTRVWLRRFDTPSRRARLDDVPSSYWDALVQKGIRIIWLMGVWKGNPECAGKYCFTESLVEGYRRALSDWTTEDVIGSPFAIDDYRFNPDLGDDESLSRLRETLRHRGLRLLLDFVPNHFSADSGIVAAHPEVFLHGNETLLREDPEGFFPDDRGAVFAHGRDPYFPAWTDTVQVNYFSETARRFMLQKLMEVAGQCDGVRCDMAMLPLNDVFKTTWNRVLETGGISPPEAEFWPGAISAIRSVHPDFLFMAEAYWGKEPVLLEQGFEFTYDKDLMDRLRSGNVPSIRAHLSAPGETQARSVRFIENHDEARAVSAFGKERSLAAAAIIGTLPGIRFFHDGQFDGKSIHLPIQLGREPDEPVSADVREFYERLLSITKDPVFSVGRWRLLVPDHSSVDRILAWEWRDGDSLRIVIVNYSGEGTTARVRPDLSIQGETIEFRDLMGEGIIRKTRREIEESGLCIECGSYQIRVLAI